MRSGKEGVCRCAAGVVLIASSVALEWLLAAHSIGQMRWHDSPSSPEELLPLPKKPQRLPIVLSPEEVQRFLGCVLDVKHHAILTTCYAAGLRISEAVS
ncbi:hypothetical protein X750_28650 [Mesorhizobium sp. LNJC394B00]|nr:hypothetical protein X750_28650 [Mesorhizobium sp. LNJC394B00]